MKCKKTLLLTSFCAINDHFTYSITTLPNKMKSNKSTSGGQNQKARYWLIFHNKITEPIKTKWSRFMLLRTLIKMQDGGRRLMNISQEEITTKTVQTCISFWKE
jgi:hypothetical protein